jgi:hypothetical protein
MQITATWQDIKPYFLLPARGSWSGNQSFSTASLLSKGNDPRKILWLALTATQSMLSFAFKSSGADPCIS